MDTRDILLLLCILFFVVHKYIYLHSLSAHCTVNSQSWLQYQIWPTIFTLSRSDNIDKSQALYDPPNQLHNFYCSQRTIRITISRAIGLIGHVARKGENRNSYRLLVSKPEGNGPLAKSRRLWGNIKICIEDLGWESVEWINVAQDRDNWRAVVKTVMKNSNE